MRELVHKYVDQKLSRRGFLDGMKKLGYTMAAAQALLEPIEASETASKEGNSTAGSQTVEGTGGELFVAQAKAAGVDYLFTNPGSFEVGFFDAFTDTPGMQLINGLHEGVVISMADGYHRVSLKPAFVNVHVIAGTAQMAGQLYNASKDGSALVVTAGLNDNELWSDDAGLAPRPGFDQKEVVRQFTKISWECRSPEALPLMLRRAFKVAATAPGGPVYLATAHHALEAKGVKGQILPADRFLLRTRVRPSKGAVEDCARLLAEAKNPVMVVGDEVWKSGAQAKLIALSEKYSLPLMSGTSGYRNIPALHPHNLGGFSMANELVKRGVDLIVVVGAADFGGRTVPKVPEVPEGARIVRIGMDTAQMSRNYATDLALIGDVKETLTDLAAALDSALTKDRLSKLASERGAEYKAMSAAMRQKKEATFRANFGKAETHPDELNMRLAALLDRDAIVVGENLSESLNGKYDLFPFGFRENEMTWIGNTGYSLGWGIGAATGAKLAAPDRQVVCTIGDGSVMYSAPGFWTQKRYQVPVLTVVWNNHNYQTVRHAYANYKGKMEKTGHYAGMYLGEPDIDFAQLAASQGVKGEKVTSGKDIDAALKRGIQATRDGNPYLVEVTVSRWGGGADSTWYEKFSLADQRKRKV
jgi:benzoylformate decarboxylase